MATLVLIWITLILVGMKKSKDKVAFSEENAMALRGICAVEIMIGHLGIATESVILFPNRKAGILFVGVFFALSGYGLMHSITCKKQYLDNFLGKRLLKILIPAYVVFLTNIMMHSLLEQNAVFLLKAINLKEIFSLTNWYVWEQSAMYILFFVCGKLDESFKKSSFVLLGVSGCFVCCAFAMKFDNPWYGSTMCFGLGILLYLKNDIWVDYLCKKHWILKVEVCIAFLLIAIAAFFYCGGIVGDLIARNVASLLFVIIIFICLQKFSIGNPVTMWLGKHSYEIYLFHLLIIGHLRPYINNDVLYAYSVVVLTLFSSFVYKKCVDWVKRFCVQMK